MNNEEIQINEILGSIDKIQRAKPRKDLFDAILKELPKAKIIPLKKLYWVAAASIILISINIATITNTSNSKISSPTELNTSLYLDYNLYE